MLVSSTPLPYSQQQYNTNNLAANKIGNLYIFDSGDVVSALGATVVGILGSIYGHWSPGDALPSMMPGIMVLLPVSFHPNLFIISK